MKDREGFHVLASTARSQAATMVLAPGDSTGGACNRHPESDQWLYVVSGSGHAMVKEKAALLEPGSLLLIEAGEQHEIDNTGEEPLVTLNFYSPPEY